MRSLLFNQALAVLALTAVVACDDDTSSGGGGNGAGGQATGGEATGAGGQGGATSGGGGQGGGVIEGLSATWTVTEILAPQPPNNLDWATVGPLVDLEVCLLDGSKCSTTDANGVAMIPGLPESTSFAVVLQKAGFSPLLTQFVMQTSDLAIGSYTADDAELGGYVASAGCTIPPAAGKSNLWIGLPPGASVTSSPALAFVYGGADGVFDPALTEVPAATPPPVAQAVACDVDPGTFELTIHNALGSCAMYEGWPPAGNGDLQALTVADMTTVVNWVCN